MGMERYQFSATAVKGGGLEQGWLQKERRAVRCVVLLRGRGSWTERGEGRMEGLTGAVADCSC